MGALGQISETALTRQTAFQMEQNGLPNTFVPGRNLLFFTFAAAVAWRRGIRDLVGGMSETDYSGYPDCRDNTLKALEAALTLGMDRRFSLQMPLMWLDKAKTWSMANTLGGEPLIEILLEHTHTCYQSTRGARHDWGYGCGCCPACRLRQRGFETWRRQPV
jgi:7-cyano-7-deazaguanine synthase